MRKPKEKQVVDLLTLPQKERIHLCREIRNILQRKIIKEKGLQRKTETGMSFGISDSPRKL